jgi:two-component system NarL family response regulator
VDDHELVRKALGALLATDKRFKVIGECGSAREALDRLAALPADVVLLDMAMPDMNGMEATQRILARSPNTRVVALSSYADSRYVSGVLRAGAHGYVLKANAYEELRSAVLAAAAGRIYLCSEVRDGPQGSLRSGLSGSQDHAELGEREREVLQMIAEGATSPGIARRLGLSTSTVETHRRNLMRKLRLHGVAQLTRYAIRKGLTQLDP